METNKQPVNDPLGWVSLIIALGALAYFFKFFIS